jgi:hypothetical protein
LIVFVLILKFNFLGGWVKGVAVWERASQSLPDAPAKHHLGVLVKMLLDTSILAMNNTDHRGVYVNVREGVEKNSHEVNKAW